MSIIKKEKNDDSVIQYMCFDKDFEIPELNDIIGVAKIKSLVIIDIQDSRNIQQILSAIPLEVVASIEISDCNMEGIDTSFFEHMQSLERVTLVDNQGIYYNEIFKRIPNKDKIKSVYVSRPKEEEEEMERISFENIKMFSGAEILALEGFQEFGENEIEQLLSVAPQLKYLRIPAKFSRLDFLLQGNAVKKIELITPEFDKSKITPDISTRHKYIGFKAPRGKITLEQEKNRSGYNVGVALGSILEGKAQMQTLFEGANQVNICSKEIEIDTIEDLEKMIERKEVFSKVESFSVKIPHIGVIGNSQLQRLKEEFPNLDEIKIFRMEDNYISTYSGYKIDEYEILTKKVEEIVGDIPKEFSDLQKFMIIYQRLAGMIAYDQKLVEEEKKRDKNQEYDAEYIKENEEKARNLLNGLLKGKSVCAGYSDILYNCLKSIGIDACNVSGNKHTWNKVKLDGIWYNVDLTWDCKDITQYNARGLKYCLRSDEVFKEEHKQEDGKKVKCNKDYPRREIVKAFIFAERFNNRTLDAEYEVVTQRQSDWRNKLKIPVIYRKINQYKDPESQIEKKDGR